MKQGFLRIGMTGATILSMSFSTLGCHDGTATVDASAAQVVQDEPAHAGMETTKPQKGGAQVWAENCIRCHNLRHPRERSDREWDIIMHHMRVRANLSAEEHRLIRQFLVSAN